MLRLARQATHDDKDIIISSREKCKTFHMLLQKSSAYRLQAALCRDLRINRNVPDSLPSSSEDRVLFPPHPPMLHDRWCGS